MSCRVAGYVVANLIECELINLGICSTESKLLTFITEYSFDIAVRGRCVNISEFVIDRRSEFSECFVDTSGNVLWASKGTVYAPSGERS